MSQTNKTVIDVHTSYWDVPRPTQCLFFHSQHLTHGISCKQTDGRSEAREVDSGTHVQYTHITLAVIPTRVLVHLRSLWCVCLQAVSNEAPTSLHQSDCSRGACAFQCPIHKRAAPSRQPTQMLCIPTKGHPPTLCCLNDSPAHVTMKKAEQIVKCMISGGWKVFRETLASVPLKLFITARHSNLYKKRRVKGWAPVYDFWQMAQRRRLFW